MRKGNCVFGDATHKNLKTKSLASSARIYIRRDEVGEGHRRLSLNLGLIGGWHSHFFFCESYVHSGGEPQKDGGASRIKDAPHNSNFLYVAQNPWEWIRDRDPPRASVVGSPSSPLNRFMTLERTTFVPNATCEGVCGLVGRDMAGQFEIQTRLEARLLTRRMVSHR